MGGLALTAVTRASAKNYFLTGSFPTQSNFADLIDSCLFQVGTSGQAIASNVSASGTFEVYNTFSVKGSALSSLSGNAIVSGALTVGGSAQSNLTGNTIVSGALTVAGSSLSTLTGNLTVTGTPTFSSLTASRGVVTNASKVLVSVTAALTNSLSGDVALNNTSNYFTGPTLAQGSNGTFWAAGTVTVTDTAGGANITVKLWDGTTVISSTVIGIPAANAIGTGSLSGFLTNPAGNIRISVKDSTSTSGKILFNQSGESKDATLSVQQIA